MSTSFTSGNNGTQGNGTPDDIGFTGSEVLDPKGNGLGTIKDVVYEGSASVPTWLVVKPGMLRAKHFVPARGSYRTDNDKVVVPFDRHVVMAGPKVNGDHVVTSEQRAMLVQHYHLN